MAEPMRLGMIGTGIIVNSSHWPAVQTLPGDFEVAALCNRTVAKAEALATVIEGAVKHRPVVYSDYHEMLQREHLDAVLLALPTLMNPEVTQAALAAGCHVLVEKPIAASVEDGERMLAWPAQYGRLLMIGENCRYLNSYQHAARLVADGAIGAPVTASCLLFPYTAPDNPLALTAWRQNPAHPGGFISDGGVHHVAILRTVLGDVADVQAEAASYRADIKPLDTLAAVLRFTSGVMGDYHVSYAVRGPQSPLYVVGTKGMIAATNDWAELRPVEGTVECWDEPSQLDGFVSMWADFAHAIRTGQPPLSTPEKALGDLRTVVAMLQSAQTGQRVAVASVGSGA
jgi:predicted dehydrogenase